MGEPASRPFLAPPQQDMHLCTTATQRGTISLPGIRTHAPLPKTRSMRQLDNHHTGAFSLFPLPPFPARSRVPECQLHSSRHPPPTPRTIPHRLQNNLPCLLHSLSTAHNLNRLALRLIPWHIDPASSLLPYLIDLAPPWSDDKAISFWVGQDEVAGGALALGLL